MIKCQQCKKPITGKNYGRFTGTAVINLCSVQCRADNLATRPAPSTSAGSVTPKPGKARARTRKTLKTPANSNIVYSEAAISKAIAKNLDRRAIYHTRLQSNAIRAEGGGYIRGCPAGTPDRMAVMYGVTVFFEVKRTGEKATPAQIETGERLKTGGNLWFEVDSFEKYYFIADLLKKEAFAAAWKSFPGIIIGHWLQIRIDERLKEWQG